MRAHAYVEKLRTFGAEEIPIYYDPDDVQEEFDGVCKELNFFGLRFRLYDFLMGWWERKSDRDLVDFIDDSLPVTNAVELGVGTGYLLRLMARRYPLASIRGSDLSMAMLRVAKEKLVKHGHSPYDIEIVTEPSLVSEGMRFEQGDHIVLVREDCRNINVSDGSQDLIASSYLLDLLPPERILGVLAEIRRLLKPSGKAYLMTLTSDPEKKNGLFERLEYFHFRMRNGFYGLYYRSNLMRKFSHALFEGYYTHCRPIDLSSYVRQTSGLTETRARQSYIRICGAPYLPVKILEVARK